MGVEKELYNQGGFNEYVSVICEGGNHAGGVDQAIVIVVWAGVAGDIDEAGGEGKGKLAQGDLSAVRIGTVVSGIESDGHDIGLVLNVKVW